MCKCLIPIVGPTGLEPVAPCPDSYRESQVHVSFRIISDCFLDVWCLFWVIGSLEKKKHLHIYLCKCLIHIVGPTGLEPVTPCPDSYRESQVLISFWIISDCFLDVWSLFCVFLEFLKEKTPTQKHV